MHLTNDLADPAAWTIPANTTVPAKGFLVLWADNGRAPGPLHATFELNPAGGVVALFMKNGLTLVDLLEFGALADNASYGRYPDGTDQLILMHDHPSPGGPNVPDDPGGGGGNVRPPAGPGIVIIIGSQNGRLLLAAVLAAVAAVAAGLFLYGRRNGRKGPMTGSGEGAAESLGASSNRQKQV